MAAGPAGAIVNAGSATFFPASKSSNDGKEWLTVSDRMTKLNCWEFKKCGRRPQGIHVHDKGLCPAAAEDALDGIHDGTNAGGPAGW